MALMNTQEKKIGSEQSELSSLPPRSISEALFGGYIRCDLVDEWEMTNASRCALIMLLSEIRPECAIEIGTARGGSLSVISRFSKKVYTLDRDPTCRERLGSKFPNVEFITGRSQETLPALLERIQGAGADLGFVLIDAGHSRDEVKQDIENLLRFRPSRPLYVLIHDSFHPSCRRGIVEANWADSPYVHFVELDFVSGIFPGETYSTPEHYRQMWDGFALALMLPVERKNVLIINVFQELLFQTVLPHSVYYSTLWKRLRAVASLLRQKIRGA